MIYRPAVPDGTNATSTMPVSADSRPAHDTDHEIPAREGRAVRLRVGGHTRYRELGCEAYHYNCADNFRMALGAIGLAAHAVPAPLNLWMNVPLDAHGRFRWTAPVAASGDTVVLEVLLDCIVVMSACPQDLTAVNGEGEPPGPLRFRVRADAGV